MMKGNLDTNFSIIQKWFYDNHMVVHPDKCKYILTGSHILKEKIDLNGTKIKIRSKVILSLSVERHVKNQPEIKRYLTNDENILQ